MKTVAQLSAINLVGNPYGKAAAAAPPTNNPSLSEDDNIATGAGAGGRWYETITQKVNRIIDMALATFDGSSADDELRYLDSSTTSNNATRVGKKYEDDEEDDVNNVKKLLLATENHANSSNVKLDDNNIGDHAALVEVEICDTDTLIDLVTLAVTCRDILTYINQLIISSTTPSEDGDNNEKYFFIPRTYNNNPQQQHQRIMIHRVGWGTSSFGALCLQAAKAAQGISSSSSSTNSTILSNISQDIDLELILQTLLESNYAVVQGGGGENEDVITIYPHGVPSTPPPSINNEKSASSSLSVVDMALFQIHNTKITIQTRMTALEANATQSKVAAIQAQQSDMKHQTQQIALRHMRHYKLLMSEIAHCTTLLTNLDTMELQLYRSMNDKHIVHSYTLVKEAYQMIRKSATTTTTTTTGSINGSGGVVVDGSGGVDELIMDIQDEIDEMNEISNAILLPSSNVKDSSSQDIDEDELNMEFHRLELECLEERQQQQRPQQQRPTVEVVDSKYDNKKSESLIPAPVQIEQPSSSDGVSEEINNARQSQQQRQQQQQQQEVDSQTKALPS
jgi:hypothetical protein